MSEEDLPVTVGSFVNPFDEFGYGTKVSLSEQGKKHFLYNLERNHLYRIGKVNGFVLKENLVRVRWEGTARDMRLPPEYLVRIRIVRSKFCK